MSFGNCLNVLAQGNSSLGYTHTEEAKRRMSENYSQERKDAVANLNKGGITDPTHRENMSKSATEFWNYGSERSEELKAEYSVKYGHAVGLYDLNKKLIESYPSFSAAGQDLDACIKYISKICDTNKIYIKKYYICSVSKAS